MGELGHLIGLLTPCTQSIVATWLISAIDAEDCDWFVTLCLCTSTSCSTPDQRQYQPQFTNRPRLAPELTYVEPCDLIIVVINKESIAFIPTLDATPLRSRYSVQGTLRRTMSKPLFHLIASEQQDLVFVDEDIIKIPSDANSGSLLHSAVRWQKPRELKSSWTQPEENSGNRYCKGATIARQFSC